MPPAEEVLKTLGAQPLRAEAPRPADPVLYLDTSESMRGFVQGNAHSSLYIHAVGVLYRQAAQTYPDIEMWGISSRETKLSQLSDVENSATYSGGDTPLGAILVKLAEKVRAGKTAIFVSDMVQSEGIRDVKDLSKAMRELARDHTRLALLGFRSAFDGTYFEEKSPKGQFQARLDGTEGHSRPFYVLVAAPSSGAMDDIKRTILRSLLPPGTTKKVAVAAAGLKPTGVTVPARSEVSDPRAAFSFSPTDEAILIDPKWSIPKDDSPQLWDLKHRAPRKVADVFGGVDEFGMEGPTDQFTITKCPDTTCPLDLVFTATERLKVRSENDFGVQVTKAIFVEGKAKGQATSAGWRPAIRSTREEAAGQKSFSMSYRVTYGLTRPDSHEWVAYRIRFSAGRGNLALPEWVSEWSTLDDHGPTQVGKTLNLDAVVGTMIHEISEQAVFLDQLMLTGKI